MSVTQASGGHRECAQRCRKCRLRNLSPATIWIALFMCRGLLLQVPPDQAAMLFYRVSPVLMQHVPEATVRAWKQCARFLDPIKLIPSLVRYSDNRRRAGAAGGVCSAVLENRGGLCHWTA